jgi:predicted permease
MLAAKPVDPIVAVGSWRPAAVTVRTTGRAGRLLADVLKSDPAATLGVVAQVGRMPNALDAATDAAIVAISDGLWRAWFDSDRAVLGRVLTIDDRSYTVVGVAPTSFRGFYNRFDDAVDIWMPETTEGIVYAGTFLRVRPGAPPEAVEAAARTLFPGVWAVTSNDDIGLRLRRVSVSPAWQQVAVAIVGFGLLVLLAACANLANLLYARGTKRRGEVSVRLALGGHRSQILRLFVAETAILAIVSIGVALAVVAGVLGSVGDPHLMIATLGGGRDVSQFATAVPFDLPILGFLVVAGILAAVATGLTTAWRATRVVPAVHLPAAGVATEASPLGGIGRRSLVAIQITATVLLLLGTAAFLVRLGQILQVRARFDTSGITAAQVDLSLYGFAPERGRAYLRQVLERVRGIDGVELAALADGLPGHRYVSAGTFVLIAEDEATGKLSAANRVTGAYAGVSAGFIEAIGIRLLRGRSVAPSDVEGSLYVTVICQSLAERLWPGSDALGKRLMFGNDGHWRTVVGVTSDPVWSADDNEYRCASCVAFVPWEQAYRPRMLIMAKSESPAGLVPSFTSALRAVDDGIALEDVGPLDATLHANERPLRMAAGLISGLTIASLTIAAFGVYGVMSFLCGARVREFGVRLALGARPGQIARMVLDQALHLVLVGLLVAMFIAAVISRVYALPGVIWIWWVVPVVVLVVGLLASFLPAYGASRVDPNVALRSL